MGCAEAYTKSTLCEASPKIDIARACPGPRSGGGKEPFPDGNQLAILNNNIDLFAKILQHNAENHFVLEYVRLIQRSTSTGGC